MEDTIIRDGGFTVTLESDNTLTLRDRARLINMVPVQEVGNCVVDDITESEQIWLDGRGEL